MSPAGGSPRALVYVDDVVVDGAGQRRLGRAVGGSPARCRRVQTGFVRSYALTMLGGALLVVARAPGGDARHELIPAGSPSLTALPLVGAPWRCCPAAQQRRAGPAVALGVSLARPCVGCVVVAAGSTPAAAGSS